MNISLVSYDGYVYVMAREGTVVVEKGGEGHQWARLLWAAAVCKAWVMRGKFVEFIESMELR